VNQNEYAVISGGSKGIGFGIAEALAKRNYNLVLIGRHEDDLMKAKLQLTAKYNVQVEVLMKDLSLPASPKEIVTVCIERKWNVTFLCNVAGIGGAKDYLRASLDSMKYMVHLNVESVMSLTTAFLPVLEKSAPSYILNVGSMAGFAPIPVKNLYSATKSAVIFFSYNLRYQLKEKNIKVSCVCPGPVSTKEEIIKDTIEKLGWFGKLMMLDAGTVGEVAVRRTLNGRLIIVPGFLAKTMSVFLRLLPKRLLVIIYHKLGKQAE
jgi:uncharacterized protein